MFIEKVQNIMDNKIGINVVFNKVCDDFVNLSLLKERINNKSADIYYTDIKYNILNYFEVDFHEKIYTNPLGLITLSNKKLDRIFLKQIHTMCENIW
jgi:hypothetical protein